MPDPISTAMRVTICIIGLVLFLALMVDLEHSHRRFCAMHPDEKACTEAAPVTPSSYD